MRAGTCLKTRVQGPYGVQGKLLHPRTHFLAHVSLCVPKIGFLGAAGSQTSSKVPVQGDDNSIGPSGFGGQESRDPGKCSPNSKQSQVRHNDKGKRNIQ